MSLRAHDNTDERRPFISHEDSDPEVNLSRTTRSTFSYCKARWASRSSISTSVPALLVLLLLVNLAQGLYTLPLNRIIERRLCRDFYWKHDRQSVPIDGTIDESRCKIDQVQQGLATLQGVMETVWILGDFLMTIPLGYVAEKYGLRSVLWINMLPRAVLLVWAMLVGYFDRVLPSTAIVISPFFSILGGKCVFDSLTYALAANLSDEYTQRVTYLSYMTSITYIVSLLSPAMASATMTFNLWLPLWIGLFLLAIALPTIALLPPYILSTASPSPMPSRNLPHVSIQSLFRSRLSSLLPLLQNPHLTNLRLLLLTELLTALASSDTHLLLQYISLRYNFHFSSAGYLLAIKSVFNLLLLTLVIPFIFRTSERHASSSIGTVRLNYLAIHAGLAVSVVGVLCIGLSWEVWMLFASLPVYALGSALPVFKLSLLRADCVSGLLTGASTRNSRYVAVSRSSDGASEEVETEEHRGANDGMRAQNSHTQLYSIVMLTKTLGSLIGAPLMAATWVQGIHVGDFGLGMPYFLSAVIYAAAMAVVGCIRTSEDETTKGAEED